MVNVINAFSMHTEDIILQFTADMFHLQVTQEVAAILKVRGYLLTCRGSISVKGKGDMVTYFLEGNSPKE